MVSDARARTKVWLDTYITDASLTKDDDSTEVTWVAMYADPPYSLVQELKAYSGAVDLIFAISDPETEPIIGNDGLPHHYRENVPITTACIDKTGITGAKLQWKANQELREVANDHPEGSRRTINLIGKDTEKLGSTVLYKNRFVLSYSRRYGEA